ncbi:TetR/AcrR family transcriptional regulator [Actinomadura kijaniata]|uniref:TetR/AcrR family transcriptional regulator n=1 Tax=Actinomadura kijaniata TaxID=46161 RepID=UPI00082C72BA|nr:TetR/AcrR family transcriptional regulator [Actinomadura kijaniata]
MSATAAESGTRNRTRQAILAAAARVLGRNHRATLADVAREADVGRSTLHRYFSDRDELMRAVVVDSLAMADRAVRDAAPDQGPAREALHRLIAAMIESGDRVIFLWSDPRVLEDYGPDPADGAGLPADPDATLRLIRRGQREGVLDPTVPAEWIQNVLWGLVYTGVEAAGQGVIPRHGVTAMVIRTLENGFLVSPD